MYDPELELRVRDYVQFQREVRKVNVIDRDVCSQLLALQQRHSQLPAAAPAPAPASALAAAVSRPLVVPLPVPVAQDPPSVPKIECDEPSIKSEPKSERLDQISEAADASAALPTPPTSDNALQQQQPPPEAALSSSNDAASAGGVSCRTATDSAGGQLEPVAETKRETDFLLVASEHDHWRVWLAYNRKYRTLGIIARIDDLSLHN